MRYDRRRLLLMPPKTASRFCHRRVVGREIVHRNTDRQRHVALHQIPDDIVSGREVFCLTRDPYEWYESFYAHMRRSPSMPWNALWGHSPVPSFRDALRDYCRGWRTRRAGDDVLLGDTNVLKNQRKGRCGLWSYLMWWTSTHAWPAWNEEARWIFIEDGVVAGLHAAGFQVDTYSLDRPGDGKYRPHEWDDQMRGWVQRADGETLRKIETQKVFGGEA